MQNSAIALIDEIIYSYAGRHLADLECEIIKYSLNGLTYAEMVEQIRCSEKHISDTAYRLFALLSMAAGERVKKKNLRSFVARKSSAILIQLGIKYTLLTQGILFGPKVQFNPRVTIHKIWSR